MKFNYKEETINGVLIKHYNEIQFNGGSNLVSSALLRVYLFFEGDNNLKKHIITNNINSYYFGRNFYINEYINETDRNNDIKILEKDFKLDKHRAVIDSNGNQLPEFDCFFDYKGKFYSIIEAHGSLIEQDKGDKFKGVYNGVILSPSLYY